MNNQSLDSKIFLISDKSPSRSYGELIRDVRCIQAYTPALRAINLYEFYVNFVAALVRDLDLTLIDSTLKDDEVYALMGASGIKLDQTKPVQDVELFSVSSLADIVRKTQSKITLFTSGTTGQPKKVVHRFSTLSTSLKRSEKFSDDIWALAYSPTHMAGLQVFIQAVGNANTIVDVFGKSRTQFIALANKHEITCISATPTFYRLLMPANFVIGSVRRATLGGEKSDSVIIEKIKQIFPSSKISNIYASTEAGAVLHSKGTDFEVLDNFLDKVRVIHGELQIHSSVLGEIEAIESKFDSSGEWYLTSDLVEVISELPLRIRFISRKNEMINVGGYKVNPIEVEETLLTHSEVIGAFVSSKKNSVLGHILVAEVKTMPGAELTEHSLRNFLVERLQMFKIPRMIKFVSELQTTSTGKVKRS